MGARLSCLRKGKLKFEGIRKKIILQKRYWKLGEIVPSDVCERRLAPYNRLFLFDLETLTVVKDHSGVRRALTSVPGWMEQTPSNGALEYWFYFSYDHERKWPAAKARLPWPTLQDASVQTLQAFVHVVNRVAHRTIFSVVPASEIHHLIMRRNSSDSKSIFAHKAAGEIKRFLSTPRISSV